ncbi:MAG: RpiB/LacA/LacB family sugar-phosphate isomerase [Oscillospiraceae bacterium]|nr:RpiB/LacA/LacB family sugar-phosphate isomerase [Oscillospiraceae bacterium]
MKIALINENSQSPKSELIYSVLKKVVEPMGHTVYNYGMHSAEDETWLTYVQNGIMAAVLLNSGAADYVVTGCGTGEGAMLALNSFPGIICGLVIDPSDAFMFAQINDGNAISMPFAKGFGWGAECNLEYVFEKLFGCESGGGYPKEKQAVERSNKKILDAVRANNFHDLITCLKGLDHELLKGTLSSKHFKELFYANSKDQALTDYVKSIVGE